MSDVPYPSDLERLRSNIREELTASLMIWRPDLSDSILDQVAEAIATNVDYAFSVTWSPDWVKEGQPHRWSEPVDDTTKHFVECLRCKRITVHPSEEAATEWWQHHAHEEHL